ALHLLQRAAEGGLAEALALEGGISSAQWAGPADIRSQTKRGTPIQGTAKKEVVRVRFGFAAEDIAYEIALGLPTPSRSLFCLDPEVKEEYVWQKPRRRRANTWLEREGPRVSLRDRDEQWTTLDFTASVHRSILADLGEPERFPEVF